MYANNKIHGIILISCVLCYLVSPKTDLQVSIQQVSATETKTETGAIQTGVVSTVQAWTKEDTDQKMDCDTDCKVKQLVKLWISDKIAGSLVYTCKDTAKDPVKCIKLGASIVKAESGGGAKCYKNGCFGILAGGISYKTREEGVEDWVRRYNKFWHRQENPSNFYSNSPDWKPKTHYCLSEHQPNGTTLSYCPNWHKHSWDIFNKLSKKF